MDQDQNDQDELLDAMHEDDTSPDGSQPQLPMDLEVGFMLRCTAAALDTSVARPFTATTCRMPN